MKKFPNLAITGHRPADINNPEWVKQELHHAFQTIQPGLVIQGMAPGVDLWSGVIAYKEQIPYLSVFPWAGHKYSIAKDHLSMYEWVEAHSHDKKVLDKSIDYPGRWAYFNRNHYMVDNAEVVVAVWNGKQKGGTYEALQYARKKKDKNIFIISPSEQKSYWEKYDHQDSLFEI